MSNTKRLGVWFTLIFFLSFGVQIYLGAEIYRQAPPVPGRVQSSNGELVYSKEDIDLGRQLWQSTGGQQQGSIWGYVAPDWSADWLHREALALRELWAQRGMLG